MAPYFSARSQIVAIGAICAVHRIDALERDHLRRVGRHLLQQLFEMAEVVVAEDVLLAAAAPDALDHRGVVQLVGEDHEPRHQPLQRRQRRVVGDIARGEQQRRLLAVQVGQLGLELDVIMRRAGDVARAAGAGADRIDRLVHGRRAPPGLAHAEIVVRAPHGDVADAPTGEMLGRRIRPAAPLQIGENPVPALRMQRLEMLAKAGLVIDPILDHLNLDGPCPGREPLDKLRRPISGVPPIQSSLGFHRSPAAAPLSSINRNARHKRRQPQGRTAFEVSLAATAPRLQAEGAGAKRVTSWRTSAPFRGFLREPLGNGRGEAQNRLGRNPHGQHIEALLLLLDGGDAVIRRILTVSLEHFAGHTEIFDIEGNDQMIVDDLVQSSVGGNFLIVGSPGMLEVNFLGGLVGHRSSRCRVRASPPSLVYQRSRPFTSSGLAGGLLPGLAVAIGFY